MTVVWFLILYTNKWRTKYFAMLSHTSLSDCRAVDRQLLRQNAWDTEADTMWQATAIIEPKLRYIKEMRFAFLPSNDTQCLQTNIRISARSENRVSNWIRLTIPIYFSSFYFITKDLSHTHCRAQLIAPKKWFLRY